MVVYPCDIIHRVSSLLTGKKGHCKKIMMTNFGFGPGTLSLELLCR